jgi:hypothetical protein
MKKGTEGAYAQADSFTELDRKLLTDHQHREVARQHTLLAGGILESYERREIFTFHHPEVGTWRFDVRLIKNALLDGRLEPNMLRLDTIGDAFYQHVIKNNGVDPARLRTLSERDLHRPGIFIAWPDGSTLIDGNHRMCRLYQLGRPFRFLLVPVEKCGPFMCRPGDEHRLFGEPAEGDIRLHSDVHIED